MCRCNKLLGKESEYSTVTSHSLEVEFLITVLQKNAVVSICTVLLVIVSILVISKFASHYKVNSRVYGRAPQRQ